VLPDTVSSAGGQNGLGSSTGTAGWAYQIYFNDAGAGYPLGSLIPIDGTSIASPATAGGLGAVESQLFANVTPNAKRSNVRLGRLMDFLYATGENPAVFYDITTGSSVGNLPGTSTPDVPTVGFDLATGWGAINYAGLESYLRGAVYSVTALGTGVKPAAYGTYLSGTLNSPNSTYDIQSSNVSGLGQVAGTEIDFTPANKPKGYAVSTATLTIGVKSFAGATNQLYFYNWKTNNWVYSEAYPLFGSTVTNTYSLNPATYANPTTGEVRILTRSVLPTRIGTNTYIYQVSKATVAFSAVPSS
jgi:hypothetical protein